MGNMDNSVNGEVKANDFLDTMNFVCSKKSFIFKLGGLFFVIGFVVSFTSVPEYESSCKVLPEITAGEINGGFGNLSDLAGLAGVSLNSRNRSNLLDPSLYPEMIQSLPFQWDIINTPIYFDDIDTTVSSYEYFRIYHKSTLISQFFQWVSGLPSYVVSTFQNQPTKQKQVLGVGENLVQLSEEDTKLMASFRERIVVDVDIKNGMIALTCEMPDPYAAAIINGHIIDRLKKEITEYKLAKAKRNLSFVMERYQVAKKEFEAKQMALAIFADANKNMNSSLVQIEFQQLQNEYNIVFEVYKGLANQVEQAKLNLEDEMPIFLTIDPAKIPVNKSKPQRKHIIVFSTVFGVLLGLGVVLIRKFLDRLN